MVLVILPLAVVPKITLFIVEFSLPVAFSVSIKLAVQMARIVFPFAVILKVTIIIVEFSLPVISVVLPLAVILENIIT